MSFWKNKLFPQFVCLFVCLFFATVLIRSIQNIFTLASPHAYCGANVAVF